MPNTITNYGIEVCGTLTRRHDSSPCADRGQNVVAQPSALEPTVCHPWGIGKGREAIIGQIGTTERLGNAWWPEVSFTLQTAGGDASPTIIDRTIRTKKGGK